MAEFWNGTHNDRPCWWHTLSVGGKVGDIFILYTWQSLPSEQAHSANNVTKGEHTYSSKRHGGYRLEDLFHSPFCIASTIARSGFNIKITVSQRYIPFLAACSASKRRHTNLTAFSAGKLQWHVKHTYRTWLDFTSKIRSIWTGMYCVWQHHSHSRLLTNQHFYSEPMLSSPFCVYNAGYAFLNKLLTQQQIWRLRSSNIVVLPTSHSDVIPHFHS